jgi:DNA polymerase-3 subunit epsilon
MDLKKKFWITAIGGLLGVAALLGGLLFYYFNHLTLDAQTQVLQAVTDNLGPVLLGGFFVLLGYLLLVNDLFHTTILPLFDLTEETTLISTVNPGHRVQPKGCRELVRLSQSINDAAERLQEMQMTVGQHLESVNTRLEEEKSTLAAVIAGLPEGILVCNLEGDILLYNQRAREFFPCSEQDQTHGFLCGFLGLGRSVYSLIEPFLIETGIQALSTGLKDKRTHQAYSVMTKGAADRLLRMEMVPVFNKDRGLNGFILVLQDLSQQMEIERTTQDLIEWFMEETHYSVAGICESVDEVLKNRARSQQDVQHFKTKICENVQVLSGELEEALEDLPGVFRTQWPMQRLHLEDLVALFKKEAGFHSPVRITTSFLAETGDVEVEIYTFVKVLLILLNALASEHDVQSVTCRTSFQGEQAQLDLIWSGDPVPETVLAYWKQTLLQGQDRGLNLSVREVLVRHRVHLSSKADYGGNAYLRLSLPLETVSEEQGQDLSESGLQTHYDFGMFDHNGWGVQFRDKTLEGLTCTVFDLETTGLDPQGGDEIVSISGVRVMNGRVLEMECFDQLVNPGRTIPQEAIRVHGIENEEVQDKPGIEEVLPLFYKFAEGTVLVAHSAMFDLAFLKKGEARSGIQFQNPVLDTFQLSVLVHPNKKDHSIEAICARLGVQVQGRHSAFGDAVTTANIFLKLLPLLHKRGIWTLEQALETSRKTPVA